MNESNAPASPAPHPRRTLLLVQILAAIAFAVSAYLLWGSLRGQALLGCGLESGCGTVTSSRWARIFGIPVSALALVLYAQVLWATRALTRFSQPVLQRALGFLLTGCGTALVAAALWFVGLQVFVIGSICPFCMAAHVCGLCAGLLLLFRPRDPALTQPGSSSGLRAKAGPALAGFFAVLILAGAQVLEHPKTYSVTSAAQLATRKTPRKLQLDGGAFELDLNDVPFHGSPDAPCIIVHLFDYSCPHCRALHPILNEVLHTFSNQVAIASLPVPLATNCNPLIKRYVATHANACAYAYCGLAVWRANPAKSPAFDDWLFASSRPPSPELAKAEAMRLVGTNEFNRAVEDPWVQQQLSFNIGLYKANYMRYRTDALPELLIGTNLISGTVTSVADLYRLLTNQFELNMPAAAAKGE
ncbi:MAG TPA: vitamin K epoxide reductase family protein [Verrucomicrobiae bacterium]|nr:vitamin K epoxide reductase family protein [Verrucomicrobiae bacterium]